MIFQAFSLYNFDDCGLQYNLWKPQIQISEN